MFMHGTNRLPHTLRFCFDFANANLHDNGVIAFAHTVDFDVSRSINNWVAKDWFGMNDLNM